jgi:hypothetical protein
MNDHNNKINVLTQLVAPSVLFKNTRTKENSPVKLMSMHDHNNKINVLPQLVVPSILFKITRTKVNSPVIADVYE